MSLKNKNLLRINGIFKLGGGEGEGISYVSRLLFLKRHRKPYTISSFYTDRWSDEVYAD